MKKIVIGIALAILAYLAIHIILFNIGGSSIPEFKYYSFTGKATGKEILAENKKTIFLYALPDCDICTAEIDKLNNLRKNTDFNLVIVLPLNSNFNYAQSHFSTKSLRKNDAILIDMQNTFLKDFGLGIVAIYPTLVLYDENRHFVAKYGHTPDKI
ncbi:TlpA family protein disulfide reductase [Flavobacterium pallidum]|uniref:Redoxin domain-containing protein n=1 Tax=Flavobacterium pallidum TaxID=2172098 RepID=A0A2S1SG03_9FLAO|nr:redoxin family protein [Flavobacterium pallidum]AWI25343.1 hypothetical protein HYN49_05205 [Flavobacterium pallidum]